MEATGLVTGGQPAAGAPSAPRAAEGEPVFASVLGALRGPAACHAARAPGGAAAGAPEPCPDGDAPTDPGAPPMDGTATTPAAPSDGAVQEAAPSDAPALAGPQPDLAQALPTIAVPSAASQPAPPRTDAPAPVTTGTLPASPQGAPKAAPPGMRAKATDAKAEADAVPGAPDTASAAGEAPAAGAPSPQAARGQRKASGAASHSPTREASAAEALPDPHAMPNAAQIASGPLAPTRPAMAAQEVASTSLGAPERVAAADPARESPDAPAAFPGALAATPAAPSTAETAAPAAARTATHAAPVRQVAPVAVALSLDPAAGGRIALQLDPGELGRVEIVVERTRESASVHVAAERPETLALLARDGAQLDRALRDAGIGGEGGHSLSFSLLSGDGGGGGGGGAPGDPRGGGTGPGRGWRDAPSPRAEAPRVRDLTTLLDIAI